MKVDVTACMLELLLNGQRVNLPGIGNFTSKNISSRIENGKIYPPYDSVVFSENQIDSEDLVIRIREKYGLNKRTAQSVIKRYAQNVISKLVNFNKVGLPNLGVLRPSKDGILFIEERNILNAAKYILPIYTLKPIELAQETKHHEKPPVVVAPTQSKEKLEPTSKQDLKSEKKLAYTSPPDTSSNRNSFFWPLLYLLLLIALILFGLKKCTSYINNNSTDGSETAIVSSEESGEGLANVTNGVDEGEANSEESEFVYNSQKEYTLEEMMDFPDSFFEDGCIIIVGSFSKNRNALRMTTKVENLGYSSYKSLNKNGLTRVGVQFDCSKESIRPFIQKVRSDINPDSWYLLPRVRVDK